MSAARKEDRPGAVQAQGQLRNSPSSLDYGRSKSAPLPSRAPAPQQSKPGKPGGCDTSEQRYIASLRRSIKQMKDGDVQPVREGLAELRRELDADDDVDSMDA